MANAVMNNLKLNIQLNTIHGSFMMIDDSVNYRYNMIMSIREQTKNLQKIIRSQQEVEGEDQEALSQLSYFMNDFDRRIDQYSEQYESSQTVMSRKTLQITEIYEYLLNNQRNNYEQIQQDVNKIYDDMYQTVLGDQFINYNDMMTQFEDVITKIQDASFLNQVEQFFDYLEAQAESINRQNDVISSAIELIKEVNKEVK